MTKKKALSSSGNSAEGVISKEETGMTENNVHQSADMTRERAATVEKTTFPVLAIDGTVIDSPSPAVQEDGYLEIQIGDRADHRLNVSLTRNEDEAFWRINLPGHDGEADSTVEIQNRICRLVLRASSLCLMLNSGTLGRRA